MKLALKLAALAAAALVGVHASPALSAGRASQPAVKVEADGPAGVTVRAPHARVAQRRDQVRVKAPGTRVAVDGSRVRVAAPHTRVTQHGGKVRVAAPHTRVAVDDRRVRVTAPYVDLLVRW